ncbi:peptidyl-prolyl cis-trans isomerase [Pseudalkalibacillus sp. SCS-8]|uniref:peptidyl-prolyl cis-trans isomerase n=1 Tax=Pseudalkalibacillus nanhaiensis TaxID=3115291 RepID=UPI0032DA3D6C
MRSKWLIGVSAFLLITNIGTLIYFTSNDKGDFLLSSHVAEVGEESISEREWVEVLKQRYGKEILTQMINKKVVAQLAEKHEIRVSEKELKREIDLYHRMVGAGADAYEHPDIDRMNDEELAKEIEHAILLEELITKDVVIKEEDLRKYYKENQHLYDLKPLYHISQIVVPTKDEAEQIMQELESGSSFSTLARERSIDEFSAPSGGAMGWIDVNSNYVDPAYFEELSDMGRGEWRGPIEIQQGYGIVYLHDTKEGTRYTYEEVKGQIKRQIAIQQLGSDFDPKQLWDEVDVSWEYGSN